MTTDLIDDADLERRAPRRWLPVVAGAAVVLIAAGAWLLRPAAPERSAAAEGTGDVSAIVTQRSDLPVPSSADDLAGAGTILPSGASRARTSSETSQDLAAGTAAPGETSTTSRSHVRQGLPGTAAEDGAAGTGGTKKGNGTKKGKKSATTPLLPAVDRAWATQISDVTGIPRRAVDAYAGAQLVLQTEQPGCGIAWNTLAGIGKIESGHGGSAGLTEDGVPVRPVYGPSLDGSGGFAAIRDTDDGRYDGLDHVDRAVGPMQFIPSTWERWGVDANGDGRADPQQIDDAALAAARYLCAGHDMTTAGGWRAAVYSYNHLDSYVDHVAAVAQEYARLTA